MSDIRYEKKTVDVGGKDIECEVCTNTNLFHLTTPAKAKAVLESGKLKPVGESKAVNLSANENHTFGGRVKLVIDPKKVNGSLKQTCYYKASDERTRRAVDNHEFNLFRKEPGRSLDSVRAETGISPDVYKEECEWYSPETIDLPKGSIEEVLYFLTWSQMPYNVSCDRCSPKNIELTSDKSFQDMKDDISDVKQMAESQGIPFKVTSCFPFITRGHRYIPLTEDNLNRLAEGKEPEYTTERPEEKCIPREGCRGDLVP